MSSRYLQLIGILRWAVELGQIDIYTEVIMLSQYLCLPREGHLDAAYRIFWYLKKTDCSRIIFDATTINTDDRIFNNIPTEEWKDLHVHDEEPIPGNMPSLRVLELKITFVH